MCSSWKPSLYTLTDQERVRVIESIYFENKERVSTFRVRVVKFKHIRDYEPLTRQVLAINFLNFGILVIEDSRGRIPVLSLLLFCPAFLSKLIGNIEYKQGLLSLHYALWWSSTAFYQWISSYTRNLAYYTRTLELY